jgi:hypothetical protein
MELQRRKRKVGKSGAGIVASNWDAKDGPIAAAYGAGLSSCYFLVTDFAIGAAPTPDSER